ncbi:stage 0 sporulation protein B (sporulation initiation phosphotransferase) [Halobacillus karajensis]|uniref:Sporulation initiation phosphotransferase B n=2 Tax=Halobacillus karajensis TaxID=195088 RepID=A0A024P737_9BACI|nr:Spo0B domain-containing protein [Halobacillus karajensis]CDQ18130.1 Sporulation initiation phosphotransferase B [Halobacillus karajensis]CDQ24481.1 Sporulation initiation phosphotransferase B [Halobacillus karajensis]CDQ29271.1 Sporulation initiation phosphotransferase B [Halobacillus karajensis]SEH58680.1 stage 0 sporulation protein B (sporulation initiation phosphotransferase) [Halobacillus karajensis]
MMEEKEIIALLRHKRHDWMNQIQLIQGYASLGKQAPLLSQIKEVIEEAEEERKLLNSGADEFSLWLLTFNWVHKAYRIRYYLRNEVDLSRHDIQLKAYGKRMIEIMDGHIGNEELYEGRLTIYVGGQDTLGLSWEWEGYFQEPEGLKEKLNDQGFIATIFESKELSIEMTIE